MVSIVRFSSPLSFWLIEVFHFQVFFFFKFFKISISMLNSPSFTLSVWGMHGGQRTTLGISLHLPCNLPMCYCVPQVSLPTSSSGFFCLCLPSNGGNIGLGWHAGGPMPGIKWILNRLYSWQWALYYPVSELISLLHSSAYLIFYEVTEHFQKWDSKLFVWNFSDLFLAFSNFKVRFVSCVICTSVCVDASFMVFPHLLFVLFHVVLLTE